VKASRLVTVAELARSTGLQPRRVLYRLKALARKDGGAWMLRTKGKTWVNAAALQAAHPAFFEPPELSSRVEDLEERIDVAERQDEAQARALGSLGARVSALEKIVGPNRTKVDQPLPLSG
jgi:hypothetical protein